MPAAESTGKCAPNPTALPLSLVSTAVPARRKHTRGIASAARRRILRAYAPARKSFSTNATTPFASTSIIQPAINLTSSAPTFTPMAAVDVMILLMEPVPTSASETVERGICVGRREG